MRNGGSSPHGPFTEIEHAAPHHDRPDVRGRFLHDVVVRAGLTAFEAVALPPARQRDDPLVKLLAALPELLPGAIVGPRDEPVQGRRDVDFDLAHGAHRKGVGDPALRRVSRSCPCYWPGFSPLSSSVFRSLRIQLQPPPPS